MNTRFAPFRLFVFVVLGVVAMGDLNHAANVESSNNIEQHLKETEGNTAEPDQKRNLRPVDNLEVSESIFSRWIRKLGESCIPVPCNALQNNKEKCRQREDCAWSKKKGVCKDKKTCNEVKKIERCTKRKQCYWNANAEKCFTEPPSQNGK